MNVTLVSRILKCRNKGSNFLLHVTVSCSETFTWRVGKGYFLNTPIFLSRVSC